MAKKKLPVNALDELMGGGRKPITPKSSSIPEPVETTTLPTPAPVVPLTIEHNEEQQLQQLEKIIDENIRAFYTVGCALREIRDKQLYKLQGYSNFDDYCQERWDIQRAHAKRLAFASDVLDNLKSDPAGITFLPTNERQVRPLINLEPEEQRQVWEKVVEIAEKKPNTGEPKITAKLVEENVLALRGEPVQEQTQKTKRLSLTLSEQVEDLLDESLVTLKQLTDGEKKRKLSKQTIAEAALQVALAHLKQEGKESELIKKLLAEL